MFHKKGFSLVELLVVITIIGILAAVAIPLLRSTPAEATNNHIEKEYRIGVNEYVRNNIFIGYQGMLSPSTFVMNHCITCQTNHIVYYPIGIDTLFEGKHAFIVKEVSPKYIILKQLY